MQESTLCTWPWWVPELPTWRRLPCEPFGPHALCWSSGRSWRSKDWIWEDWRYLCISPQYFIDLVIKVYRDVNIDVMDIDDIPHPCFATWWYKPWDEHYVTKKVGNMTLRLLFGSSRLRLCGEFPFYAYFLSPCLRVNSIKFLLHTMVSAYKYHLVGSLIFVLSCRRSFSKVFPVRHRHTWDTNGSHIISP